MLHKILGRILTAIMVAWLVLGFTSHYAAKAQTSYTVYLPIIEQNASQGYLGDAPTVPPCWPKC